MSTKIYLTFNRLQVTVAKIQQNLPELKRDGNNVMASQATDLLYAASSTNRASTVLTMMDFIPRLTKELQDKPEETLKIFEEIRGHCEMCVLLCVSEN